MKFAEVGRNIKIKNFNDTELLLDSTISKVESDRIYVNCDSITLKKFQEGDEISCTLVTQFGLRALKSLVIEATSNLIIDYDSNALEIVYQREFIRVSEMLPAKIIILDKEIQIITQDIGGAAIKFCCDENIEPEATAEMKISLDYNQPPQKINGKIMKYNYFQENEYLFSFIDINENIRSKIIKKCLDVQAQQIRETINNNE